MWRLCLDLLRRWDLWEVNRSSSEVMLFFLAFIGKKIYYIICSTDLRQKALIVWA